MTINFIKKQIITTKTEATKASKINSDEYKELKELMNQYPSFNVVLKTTPSKRSKSIYDMKGLNYDFMKIYIAKHGTEEQLKIFDELRFNKNKSRIKPASYGEIKKWFLDSFPEIKPASASKNKKEAI